VALGAVLGASVGYLYNAIILGAQNAIVPLICALVGEAIAALYKGKLNRETRARFVLWYTLGQVALFAPVLWWWMPRWITMRATSLSSAQVALVLAAAVASVLAIAAIRFGVLSAAQAFRPRRALSDPRLGRA